MHSIDVLLQVFLVLQVYPHLIWVLHTFQYRQLLLSRHSFRLFLVVFGSFRVDYQTSFLHDQHLGDFRVIVVVEAEELVAFPLRNFQRMT